MAKLNITFVDELGSNLNRYKAIDVNTGNEYLFDLSRNGTITTQGTPLNAENMNLIVQAINNIELSYIKSITQDENGKIIITKQDDTILDLNIANVVEESVQCPHRYEITGNTGDEHGLAINDQQMLLDRVQGRTLVKNQLIDNPTAQNANITINNYKCHYVSGTGTITIFQQRIKILANHKYYISKPKEITAIQLYNTVGSSVNDSIWLENKQIFSKTTDINGDFMLQLLYVPETGFSDFYIQLIDLTQKYGAGKEPTTVEQVLNDMNGYEEYDLGSFVHSKNNLISTGRNLWDEEWELGAISDDGLPFLSGSIRSKNFCEAVPNITYYSSVGLVRMCYYDKDFNFLYRDNNVSYTHETPNNCRYFKITLADVYGTTYNHDICINVSDESFNGTYEPYQEDVMVVDRDLKEFEYIDNITNEKVNKGAFVNMGTLTYVAGTDGNGVQHYRLSGFPSNFKGTRNAISTRYIVLQQTTAGQNMPDLSLEIRSANEVYLRDLAYTTVETLKSALSGVMLYYETTTETREKLELPRGMAVWGNGMQIQKGTIPYLLTKRYSLSIGAQVKANIAIDKEQQDQINNLKNEHKELREDFDSTFSNQNVKRETSALIDYPSKKLSYPNQQVIVDEIRGRSLNINQLAQPTSWSAYNGSLTNVSNSNKETSVTIISDSSTQTYVYGVSQSVNYILNHKYLFKVDIAEESITNLAIEFGGTYYDTLNKGTNVITVTISQALNSNYLLIYPRTLQTVDSKFTMKNIEFIDLTLMYGSGKEPTDVNQVLIDIDKFKVDGYLPYNLGELKDVEFSGVKSVGVNLIPNNWTKGVWFSNITGEIVTGGYKNRKVSDFIKVTNGNYYLGVFKDNVATTGEFDIWYLTFDENKNFLGTMLTAPNKVITLNNVAYVRVGVISLSYDGILNVSNNDINGQYFPYEEDTYEIPQVDLKSAGNVYDSLYPSKGKFVNRIGVVEDLSTLDWDYVENGDFFRANDSRLKINGACLCAKYVSDTYDNIYNTDIDKVVAITSNYQAVVIRDSSYGDDVTTFKASLQGVKLYYELATPVESDIVCPNNYKAWQYGTEMQLGNFPTTIVKDYSISILDQITKNVEVDKNQSDLIDKLLENDKNVDTRISQNENKTNELDDSLENLKNQVEGFVGQNFDKTKLKIEQNLINTRLVYNNEIISSIQNLDVKYIPQIVFSVYQDTEYSAIEKANITNSTDMDMYVSIKGQKDHLNIFVPFGDSVETSQSFSVDNLEDYTADIEIKIYYNPTTVSNVVTGYTVFENVKTINLRATVYTTDK